MKKIITTLVLAAMLLTTLCATVAAESYMDKVPATCEYEVTIKKADPAVVKKDGVIDVDGGEYIKAEVPFSELSLNFMDAADYLACEEMAKSMEYYFSWDDVHGFNFAVKYNAQDGFNTNIPMGEDPEKPGDEFMCNVALNFSTGVHKEESGWALLYYAVAKNINDGSYLYGHYNQLGNSGTYAPKGGQDFDVFYPGNNDVIFEWSVPFNEILDVAPADGVSFIFTLSAGAGKGTAEAPFTNNWTVSLGQSGFLVQSSPDNKNATAIISTEPIKDTPAVEDTTVTTNTPDTTIVPGPAITVDGVVTTPAPTQEPTTQIVTEVVTSQVAVTNEAGETETNEAGEVVTEVVTEVITSVVTEAPTQAPDGNKAPVTGDPMVIAAVVAAISACGIVVAKKRK